VIFRWGRGGDKKKSCLSRHVFPYHTSDWRLRLRLRLRLLTNQKGANSYTLLSDWSRVANADVIANR